MKPFAWVLGAVGFLMLMVQCGNDNLAGNASQTGNVRGRLAKADGLPAAGVTVRFFPMDNAPRQVAKRMAAMDSTTTDANGEFATTLDSGTYNMLAATDSTAAFEDSIEVGPDTAIITDTLKLLGSLRAKVQLQGSDDPRTVFVLVMGTNIWAGPDAAGEFALSKMAEGTYNVRILTTLDLYEPLDTVLSIRSAAADTLATPIHLKYTGIPIPTGLKISYDTLKQIVILSWNRPTTGRVIKGYNVYRAKTGSTLAAINTASITDTSFIDSNVVQDSTYVYKIAAVDMNDAEGTKGEEVAVKAVPAFTLIDSIGAGLFSGYQVLKMAPTGRLYVADISGSNWKIHVFDSSLSLTRTIDSIALKYPASFDLDSAENMYLVNQDGIFKLDTGGHVQDTLSNWHNAENKTLRLYKGSVYVTGGQIKKYSREGVLLDTTEMIGADGFAIMKDTVFVGGSGTDLKMLDTNLSIIGNWRVDFQQDEIARSFAKDEQGDLYVSGYHFNPSSFVLLVYDPERVYRSKMLLPMALHQFDVSSGRAFMAMGGQVKIYRVK